MSKCITIYTDASFCPKTRVGGWGCWIKYNNKSSFQASGVFRSLIFDCTIAEMMAIANSLVVMRNNLKPSNKTLVVVTDSAVAKLTIERKTSRNKILKDLAIQIHSLVPENCILKVNKVKAHSNKDGKRSYVNNLVDSLAKKEMKNGRLKLTIKETK